MNDLKNKKVLITGSSSGLGYFIAEKFKEVGAIVILNGRDEEKLKLAANKLNVFSYCKANVSNEEGVETLLTYLSNEHSSIDILVCNLGSGQSVPPGKETSSEWRRVFDLNFWSTVDIVDKIVNQNILSEQGSIICISSICGVESIPGAPITYSVAKAALNSYIKSKSKVLEKGIRINGIAPGNILFEGSVWERKLLENPAKVSEILERDVPLKRFGTSEEIAYVVLFLASKMSSFVTGSIWQVDGGQTKSV